MAKAVEEDIALTRAEPIGERGWSGQYRGSTADDWTVMRTDFASKGAAINAAFTAWKARYGHVRLG